MKKRFLLFLVAISMSFSCVFLFYGCSCNDYGIVFCDNNSKVISRVNTSGYEEVIPPIVEEKDGYRFVGWFYEDQPDKEYNKEDFLDKAIENESIRVCQKWIKYYTIEYVDEDDSLIDEVRIDEVKNGETKLSSFIQSPQKVGKGFSFWTYYNGSEWIEFKITYEINRNLVLKAKYSTNIYNVVFKNGEETIKSLQIEHNHNVLQQDLPSLPTRTGYTSEWSISDLDNITQNLTIDVVYTPKRYNISFDYCGATSGNTITTKEIDYDSVTEDLPTPEKEGFVFAGWYYGTQALTNTTIYKFDKDIELVAKFRDEVDNGHKILASIPFLQNSGNNYFLQNDSVLTLKNRFFSDTEYTFNFTGKFDISSNSSLFVYTSKNGDRLTGLRESKIVNLSLGNNVFYLKVMNADTLESTIYTANIIFNAKSIASTTDFNYIVGEDDLVTITKYIGTSSLVRIPSSISDLQVTAIYKDAFKSISRLTSILIPTNIVKIYNSAISNCPNLTVYCEDSSEKPTWEDEWSTSSIIYGLKSLNETQDFVYGTFDNTSITMFKFKNTTATTYTIPEQVDEKDLVYIYNECFKNNTKIQEIVLSKNLTSIGNSAFESCTSLNTVIFNTESSLATIGEMAFKGCASLNIISIPLNVTNIQSLAFDSCSNLSIYCQCASKPTSWAENWNGSTTNITWNASNFAQSAEYLYLIDDDIKIVSYVGEEENVTIPSTIAGKQVTSLASNSFLNKTFVKNLVVPTSVTTIEDGAFAGMKGLISISLPFVGDELTNKTFGSYFSTSSFVGSYAVSQRQGTTNKTFYLPIALEKVTLTNTNNIVENSFMRCTSIKNIYFPSTVTTIGGGAFSNCTNLENVNMPETTSSNTTQISYYYLPDTITTIGSYAFPSMSDALVFTNGDSMPSGWDSPFALPFDKIVYGVKEFHLDITNSEENEYKYIVYEEDGVDNVAILDSRIVDYSQPLTIPAAIDGKPVKKLLDKSFANKRYSSVIIPDSVIELGSYVFYNSYLLTHITLSNSLKIIGNNAFDNCTALTSITIPSSVEKLSNFVFNKCSSLEDILFESQSNMTTLGKGVFAECSALTTLTLPESIQTYGSAIFNLCDRLANLTLPFNGMQNGETYTFGKLFSAGDYRPIYNYTKQYNTSDSDSDGLSYRIPYSLTTVTLTNITEVGYGCFQNVIKLTTVNLPATLQRIKGKAFYGCDALKTVNFGENSAVEEIAGMAFRDSGLEEIVIPNSVQTIGGGCFSDCRQLRSLTLPFVGETRSAECVDNSADAYDGLFAFYFYPYSNIASDYIDYLYSAQQKYKMYGNNDICYYPKTLTTVVITDSTEVKEYAFYNCESLTSVTYTKPISALGKHSFFRCSNLTNFSYINSESSPITTISQGAFNECNKLTSFIMPSLLETIEYYAFSNCYALSDITLPLSITSIQYFAFQNCRNLSGALTFGQNLVNIGDFAFTNCNRINQIIFSDNPIDTNLQFGASCFKGCTMLAGNIKLPRNLTYITNGAFDSTAITSVEFSNNIEIILPSAFAYCSLLETITMTDEQSNVVFENEYYTFINNCAITKKEKQNFVKAKVLTLGTTTSIIPDDEDIVTEIDTQAFKGRNISGILTIPNNITKIDYEAFAYCSQLTGINLPENLTSISSAFVGCSNLDTIMVDTNNSVYHSHFWLEEIESYYPTNCLIETATNTVLLGCKNSNVPDYVTTIGASAFKNCEGLYNIDLPDSVTKIGQYAYENCKDLTQIELSQYVTNIGEGAFRFCSKVVIIDIDEPNTVYRSENNCLILKSSNTLLIGVDYRIIPVSVRIIGDYAFYGKTLDEPIELDLTQYVNESETTPRYITRIGDYAFGNCSISSLKLPRSLSSIELYAFINCEDLTTIDVYATNDPTLARGVFENCPLTAIYVPFETRSKYVLYSSTWNQFKEIIIEKSN